MRRWDDLNLRPESTKDGRHDGSGVGVDGVDNKTLVNTGDFTYTTSGLVDTESYPDTNLFPKISP